MPGIDRGTGVHDAIALQISGSRATNGVSPDELRTGSQRLLLQLFHHALDQLFGVGKALHHNLDIQNGLAGPALALAIDSVLADQGHGIGDHVHGYGEASAGDPHHGFKMFQLFALLFEYGHVVIVNKQSALSTASGVEASYPTCAGPLLIFCPRR
jgi:hypothetical protein